MQELPPKAPPPAGIALADLPPPPDDAPPDDAPTVAEAARQAADEAVRVSSGDATTGAAGGASGAADAPHDERPHDPEQAQRALLDIQQILSHYTAVREQARYDGERAGESRQSLVERVSEAQYLSHLRARIARLHPADVAYVLEALPLDDRLVVWDSVKADADGAILIEVSEPVRESLIDAMTRPEVVAAVASLGADDLADLAEDLPPDVVDEVSRQLTPEERAQVRAAMSYPEDSVGARMDFDYVTVRESVSLETVLRYLRRFDEIPPNTDQVFIVDRNDTLKGALRIADLLVHEPDTKVLDLMRQDILTLQGLDDVVDAAQAFERYDLVSAPVLDAHGRLVGRLTIEAVIDVMREESDSDALGKAGLQDNEDLFASVWQSARNRWLWLALNMGTAFFASRVIGMFEGTIERIVALAALMPIVAGIAGNSGNQTMTLVIRSLALGHVTPANFWRLVRKELSVAMLNGLVWGTFAGAFAYLLYLSTPHAELLGLTMMLAMVLNLLIGSLIGVTVPMVLEKFGRDPAMGSSVLLTFSTDSLGFLIFLGLATVFFRGL